MPQTAGTRSETTALNREQIRAYLSGAGDFGDRHPELDGQRRELLSAAAGALPLTELASAFEDWRRAYTLQYTKSHTTATAVQDDIAAIAREVADAARILGRLNDVAELGPPEAAEELTRLARLTSGRRCSETPRAISQALQTSPRCRCGFGLAGRLTRAEARAVAGTVRRALDARLLELGRRLDEAEAFGPLPLSLARVLDAIRGRDMGKAAALLDDGLLQSLSEALPHGRR